MADAPRGIDSGLLVPIPEAEPVAGELRAAHDPAAADAIPCHVTVLFPFLPRAEISGEVRAALRDLFGGMAAFDYRFDRVERFADTTVYLAPRHPANFTSLIEATAARWPDQPPYGGKWDTVIPHLTVGDDLAAGQADAVVDALRRVLDQSGPIIGRATAVTLLTRDGAGPWATDSVLPLGRGPAAAG